MTRGASTNLPCIEVVDWLSGTPTEERYELTIRGVLAAMGRRWYVVVVALAAAATALGLWSTGGGTYTTTTIVSFAAPDTTTFSLNNGSGDLGLIAFARSVAAQVNVGRHPVTYSEDSAPYYGAGVRQGVLIDVPSNGNQFYESYKRAEVDIHVVGKTRKWVAQQQAKSVNEVMAVATSQQEELIPATAPRLTATVVPLTEEISEVAPTRSDRMQASAALVFGALIVGAGGSALVDTLLATRGREPARRTNRRPAISLKGSPS